MIGEWLETTAALALFFFILSSINLAFAFFKKPIGQWLKRNFAGLHPVYLRLVKLIAKTHSLLGILAIIFMVIHGYYGVLYRHRLPLSGILIAVTWGSLALFGFAKKFIFKKAGRWTLAVHTIIAILAVAALIYHYLEVGD